VACDERNDEIAMGYDRGSGTNSRPPSGDESCFSPFIYRNRELVDGRLLGGRAAECIFFHHLSTGGLARAGVQRRNAIW
jgi:hypothetical protein